MYNFSHIVYTHSDYDNVLEVWKYQMKKYLPNSKIHVFIDKIITEEHDSCNILLYEDSVKYTDRVISCLNQMVDENEIVIYQHEDMFLYDKPDLKTISNFVELIKNEEIDAIRLIRVVENLKPSNKHEYLFENPINDKYSTQPTLIKVKTLKKIFSSLPDKNIWEFEKSCAISCNYLKSYYCYANEKKRGLSHYDSFLYPYIATAVCKGQWNMQEYSKELTDIFYEMGY